MMDPVSLAILFGAGALVGYATQRNHQEQSRDDQIVLRRVYETNDGWICTELMSAEALNAVGQIMDLDLLAWWPKVESGFFKVVILTQPGAPVSRQVVVLLEGAGKYGWFLNQAQRHGYRKVFNRTDYQRIGQLLGVLNTDPAEEVVRTATKITDPVKRYQYLRYALTANPQLSAILSQDNQFVEVVRKTVAQPSVVELKQAQAIRAASPTPLLPPPGPPETMMVEQQRVPVRVQR
jgi:hypothetical protein